MKVKNLDRVAVPGWKSEFYAARPSLMSHDPMVSVEGSFDTRERPEHLKSLPTVSAGCRSVS